MDFRKIEGLILQRTIETLNKDGAVEAKSIDGSHDDRSLLFQHLAFSIVLMLRLIDICFVRYCIRTNYQFRILNSVGDAIRECEISTGAANNLILKLNPILQYLLITDKPRIHDMKQRGYFFRQSVTSLNFPVLVSKPLDTIMFAAASALSVINRAT